MKVSLVVAVAANGVIGRDGSLPWHLPEDLRHFKQLTMGHPIVMGRRTWQSIGRPLPGRHSIVLTRQPGFAAQGATVVGSPAAALAAAEGADEVMVIGGAEVYALFLPIATRIYRTRIDADVGGDTRFPELSDNEWRVVDSQTRLSPDWNFRIETLERIS